MKKYTSLVLIFAFFCFIFFTSNAQVANLKGNEKEKQILEIVLKTLKEKHINSVKIDDEFSKKMFKTYIDSLDRTKLFLLQSDIAEFKKYETLLDDQIKNNDLSFFYMTFDRLKLRMIEGKEMYTSIIKNKLDFTSNEEAKYKIIENDISNDFIAKNKSEQLKNWSNLLRSLVISKTKEKYAFENNGVQSINEIGNIFESGIVKYLEGSLLNADNISINYIFQSFINAIVLQYDVLSKYFSPEYRDKFIMQQTGKLIGAGISWHTVDNFTQIKQLAPGSPAILTKKLEIGDVILKVQQDNDSPINVVGYNHFEVAKLLRGKSGTVVKVTMKKPSGAIEEIAIKRGIVAFNDSYIKSCLVKRNKVTYGILNFGKFYNDFEDEKARNAHDDFAAELQILKQENIRGLLIDMRGNFGGSAEAAIQILSNFLEKNSVAQIKTKGEKVTTLVCDNGKKSDLENIVIIVNSKTEAAAELIISGFKEYNVGIVIGEKTNGKGTIQEFQDLNDLTISKTVKKDFGALNITTQKIYNLKGKAIQKKGIIPDIELFQDISKESELLKVSTINNDELKPVSFTNNPTNNFLKDVVENSKNRLSKSTNFKKAKEYLVYENRVINNIYALKTLNIGKLKTQIDRIKNELEPAKPEYDQNREFYNTAEGNKLIKRKEYLEQVRKEWLQSLSQDFQIQEGINILEDMNSK